MGSPEMNIELWRMSMTSFLLKNQGVVLKLQLLLASLYLQVRDHVTTDYGVVSCLAFVFVN